MDVLPPGEGGGTAGTGGTAENIGTVESSGTVGAGQIAEADDAADGGESSSDEHGHEPDGRRRRGLRRRAVLVDAALRVVAVGGVAAVTHAAVAAEAGLPRSAVSHHFTTLDDLLAAALRAGTEQLVADVAWVPEDVDVSWFAAELVRLFTDNTDRVAAGYELFALAARRPALRSAVTLWLDLLSRLAHHHTDDPLRVRALVATVDGYFVQSLASGTPPRVEELEHLLRFTLG